MKEPKAHEYGAAHCWDGRRTTLNCRLRAFLCLILLGTAPLAVFGGDGLRISVYATAGDVLRYCSEASDRARVAQACERLQISHIFLEGRRGDEYVPPALLAEARDFFAARGMLVSGGIATVPGSNFGLRQNGVLGWLNWEAEKTRRDVAGFFTENAPVFEGLIVDDFFCTADTSPASGQARGGRSWPAYRQDLLSASIHPLIVQPARAARPSVKLILKFPQWYDRFHLFGYDPSRMMAGFDRIWVGTEVRDPQTRRMGFVQPTEGYMNFRWLASIGGEKVAGAWFDHIECSAQNFVDQAYGSVLAGARELTLFHLGDLLDGHPGDGLLASRLPGLIDWEKRIRGQPRNGIPFYKPPGSDGDDNLYLMDYLGMIGLPILPVAEYPVGAKVVFLAAQAAADPAIVERVRRHLGNGATVIMTPAFVRRAGLEAGRMGKVATLPDCHPAKASEIRIGQRRVALRAPLEVDAGLKSEGCRVLIEAMEGGKPIPLLTSQRSGRGRILLFNVRTFSEANFRASGEWLLAPQLLGLPQIPQILADRLRAAFLEPLRMRLESPPAVALFLIGNGCCLHNYRDGIVDVRLNGKRISLGANQCYWTE